MNRLRAPATLTVIAFAEVIAIGTTILLLPVCRSSGMDADFVTALFTATSAVCICGLNVVDTGTYWSTTGHVVIMVLAQIGGFGIMTMASLIGLMISRRIGLRQQLRTTTEIRGEGLGNVRQIVKGVLLITLFVEAITALVLTLRFRVAYDYSTGESAWFGLFHAVSAWNNAGFTMFEGGLQQFVHDPVINFAICLPIILGGLGYPVLMELRRHPRQPHVWSLHTKLVLTMTAVLMVGGTLFITAMEWNNPRTFGGFADQDRMLAGFFLSANTRSGGLNTIDVGDQHPATWLGEDFLMLIGGGTGGTAGGMKITTFAVLFLVLVAETRKEDEVTAFRYSIPASTIREAVTVALLSVGAAAGATLLMLGLTRFTLDQVLFEVISALATVGLTTGITPLLENDARLVITFLMFLGRLGPLVLATAIVGRERVRRYHYPLAEPGIG